MKKIITAAILLVFVCIASLSGAQTPGQQKPVSGKYTGTKQPAKSEKVDPAPAADPSKKDIKANDSNREVKIINGKKVLVDNQGVQSFVNPDQLTTPPATKDSEKK